MNSPLIVGGWDGAINGIFGVVPARDVPSSIFTTFQRDLTMTEYEFIRFEVRGRAAWITLDRPEVLNAMHKPMAAELCDAWKRVRDEDDIWMGVLTGSGERV